MRRLQWIVAMVVMLVGWSVAPATAQANEGAFTGSAVGEAQFVPEHPKNCPGPPVGFGIATVTDATGPSNLGEVTTHFEHCPLVDGSITNGDVTITWADGGDLHATYAGTSTPIPPNIGDVISASLAITFDGGTGRFANATGHAELNAEVVFEGFEDPSWAWSATWEGSLSYGIDATLQFSKAADRSGGIDLDGATVAGKVYVFLDPLFPTGFEAVKAVEFWVNGSPIHTECCAPYDMIGGTTDGPATAAWDSATVPDGATTVAARIEFSDGTSQDATAQFTVDNTTVLPAAWGFGYSSAADRSDARPLLPSYAVSGSVYLFVSPLDPGISGPVDLYLDGELIRREYVAPYDLLGGSTDRAGMALDTTTLADGFHRLSAVAVEANEQAAVPFMVDNAPSDVETLETFPQPGPEGIAVDPEGNLFVSFSALGELRVLDPSGGWTTVSTWDVGEGLGPLGLEVDGNGNVYVAVATFDPATHGVYRVSRDGHASRLPGSEAIAFPNDVTFDAAGNLYVSDTVTGGVWRLPPGVAAEPWFVDPILVGTGEAGYPFPLGANGLVWSDDVIYVVNTELGHLVTIPVGPDGSAGAPVVTSNPQYVFPDGIAIGADGRIYTALIAQSAIAALDPVTGELEYFATALDGMDWASSLTFGEGALDATSLYAVNYAIGPPGAGPGLIRIGVGVAGADIARPLVKLPFVASFSGEVLAINDDPDDIAARCSERPAWAVVSFEGWGEAPDMGTTHVLAEHCSYVGPLPDGSVGPDGTYGEGMLTLTATDGDVLLGTYRDGLSTSPPPDVGFVDSFTFTGGTGRFADAEGGGVEAGTVDFSMGFGPGAAFSIDMEGVIWY